MAEARVPAVLGIDLGTTEAKAALLGLDGRLLGLGRAGYPLDGGPDGRAEQDPRDWWRAVGAACRAIDALADDGVEVLAVCGVGQGPTLTVIDEAADPLRPAITWQDRRPGDGGFGLLPRMAWLAREDPDAAAQARWLRPELGCPRRCGCRARRRRRSRPTRRRRPRPTSRRSASARAACRNRSPFGTPLGLLRAEAVAQLGLRARIPVVAGVNDGTASMLGAGLRRARRRRRHGRGIRRARRAARTARSRSRGCTRRPRRCRGDGWWAARWRRWARPSTGCGRRCSGDQVGRRGPARGGVAGRARRGRAPVPARTSRASGRRCSTRRHGARSSG